MHLNAKANLASVPIHRAWAKTAETGAPQAPWPWADTHPVARLRIPRIGYDEIVLEGATPRTLAFGPARLFSGANLGEPGNVELAGHRTSWFRPFEALDAGDQIIVNDIHIVAPEEVTSLARRSDNALTLITCDPFGHSPRSPRRFVALASPAGPSRLAETSRPANRPQP
jgi:sortase A